jgi:Zn-dependent alcohol dehydrogenase
MYKAKAYSAASATSPLASTTIARRDPTEHDVQIEILFCGICHSDLHQVRNEWSGVMPTVYPCVPGHEIVGRVTKVGSAVTKFKPGDLAAVGCMVDSDRTCPECKAGLEQFCPNLTSPTTSPTSTWEASPTAATPTASSSMSASSCASLQPRSRRSRAAALRRNHDLLAHAPLGRHQRARRSAWWVSADWATWA